MLICEPPPFGDVSWETYSSNGEGSGLTIAIAMKVSDGIVLAADSATTLTVGERPQIYDNANKIVNLHKKLPVGVMTWGAGGVGGLAMSTLFKDFRARWTDDDGSKPAGWSVEQAANDLADFLYTEKANGNVIGPGGSLVVGWNDDVDSACGYVLDNEAQQVQQMIDEQEPMSLLGFGQPDIILRVLQGFSPGMAGVLVNRFGVDPTDVPDALDQMRDDLGLGVMSPAMPIQDALDLAEALAEMSKTISRFALFEDQTVGGPVELAAITKHEGFKWVKRKYYYDRSLNPDN